MNYHNITKDDMLNGEGLRVVLWVAGCSHNCFNCQNPQTHDPNSGIPFDQNALEELFSYLKEDYIQGITFSGGDPLYETNRQTIYDIAKIVKEKFKKDVWLYTGYRFEQIKLLPIMKYIDILVDGEFIDNLKDEKLLWKGSSNQRIIDVQKSILSDSIILHT